MSTHIQRKHTITPKCSSIQITEHKPTNTSIKISGYSTVVTVASKWRTVGRVTAWQTADTQTPTIRMIAISCIRCGLMTVNTVNKKFPWQQHSARRRTPFSQRLWRHLLYELKRVWNTLVVWGTSAWRTCSGWNPNSRLWNLASRN